MSFAFKWKLLNQKNLFWGVQFASPDWYFIDEKIR
jgi:hypothetical protein